MGDVTSPYEHIPQRVGHEERDAAVQRLRTNLDEGRLDKTAFDERVAVALEATTQDDLDPLFEDLPPVVTSGTFELYPHQAMSPVPTPYMTDPVSMESQPMPMSNPTHWFASLPPWGKIVVLVLVVALAIAFLNSSAWWLIFILPGIFGRWGNANRNYRRRDGRRP
jgi:hypothetical protein